MNHRGMSDEWKELATIVLAEAIEEGLSREDMVYVVNMAYNYAERNPPPKGDAP